MIGKGLSLDTAIIPLSNAMEDLLPRSAMLSNAALRMLKSLASSLAIPSKADCAEIIFHKPKSRIADACLGSLLLSKEAIRTLGSICALMARVFVDSISADKIALPA